MILLVRYKGIFGGLIKGDPSVFEILDEAINMDTPVLEMLKRNNKEMLFSTNMMHAIAYHGFYYLTGGTFTYKLPPLVLVNTNHESFKCLRK